MFFSSLFQCLFEIKNKSRRAGEQGTERGLRSSCVLGFADGGGFAVSCCFLDKQRLWATGAGGVRRRWVRQAGEEGELGVGRAGPLFRGSPVENG